MPKDWPWPGARWWKMDLHAHSMASHDWPGSSDTPDQWVAAALASGLDGVAVTDHSTGSGVDDLKSAADRSSRGLTVFPGVEVHVTPGVHLLLVMDPERGSTDIAALLGALSIPDGMRGDKNALVSGAVCDVLAAARMRGAIPIAAHVDKGRGLLTELSPGLALQEILRDANLLALEVGDLTFPGLAYADGSKSEYCRGLGRIALVQSSDAHAIAAVGRRATWFKMTKPDAEGLSLALQDGALSVQPASTASADPNAHAAVVIEYVALTRSRYIGNSAPLTIPFNPWLNCLIGGRGTGKSSIIEFIRLAMGGTANRSCRLTEDFGEMMQGFEGRDSLGLWRPETSVTVVLRSEGSRFRVRWDRSTETAAIEQETAPASWAPSPGEPLRRFPVRIYSQREIFEISSDPGALLAIIDRAPEVDQDRWREEHWAPEESRFMALRAKERELQAGLAQEPTLMGQLEDVKRRLSVFEKSGHEEVLRAYQRGQRQLVAIREWLGAIKDFSGTIEQSVASLSAPGLELDLFDPALSGEREVLDVFEAINESLASSMKDVRAVAEIVSATGERTREKLRATDWAKAVAKSKDAFEGLVAKLKDAGAGDPSEYGRLVGDRQGLEQRLAKITATRAEMSRVAGLGKESGERLLALRRELTKRRQDFLERVLRDNPHVRIRVEPYGNRRDAEERLRKSLGLMDNRSFQNDIEDESGKSLLSDLYSAPSSGMEKAIEILRTQVLGIRDKRVKPRDRRFAEHLAKLAPEAFDRLAFYSPADSLRVDYCAPTEPGDFRSIDQGSPGQRTAAILAFILSYGSEPLLLDQPEDDLDSEVIYSLIVAQLQRSKTRRQVIVVTHNANIVVNADAECVTALRFGGGETKVACQGGLQEDQVRRVICDIMEGGSDAFERRYRRISSRR